MIIYGASGHGKVIIDIIKSNSLSVDHVIDDNSAITQLGNYTVSHKLTSEMKGNTIVIAIGNNYVRKAVSQKIKSSFVKALIHSSAQVSESASINEGTVVMANAIVNASVKIGKHCIVNSGAIIEHDVKLQDFVHISPGASITGNVEISEGAHIGTNASVIPGIRIGKWAMIGAGAVIVKDVPDFAVVVGNPGKIIRYNKVENE